MFNWSHSIDVLCDAPEYPLVRACRKVGFRDPEDVRWCRLSHFRPGKPGWRGLFNVRTWKALLGIGETRQTHCSCGQELPVLEKYTFTFSSFRQVHYLVGQCRGCRTIFWEEA